MPRFIEARVLLVAFIAIVMAVTMSAVSIYRAIPACLSDDGSGPVVCKWDAQAMGNGQGSSFININL